MKTGKIREKLKSSLRKHFVRKKDFEALSKDVDRLRKKLAKLEKCCGPDQTEKPIAVTKEEKTEKTPIKSAEAAKSNTTADKLTRIKGIGPVLEKKLHDLGVTRFSQITSWSKEDIDKISEHLDFKGRIEREEWVKQAKEFL